MNINDTQLASAREYLQKQFEAHTWWPKEQPEQAKYEFKLMNASATTLSIWCEKWLDAGQRRQLEKALK